MDKEHVAHDLAVAAAQIAWERTNPVGRELSRDDASFMTEKYLEMLPLFLNSLERHGFGK